MRIQPVGAAVQREVRLVLGNVASHVGDVLRGDVGRVGQDQVEWTTLRQGRNRLPQVALLECDPVLDAVTGDVAPRDRERPFRDVGCRDLRAGQEFG